MDFYVYLHKKKTTGEVFYVGKGVDKRAWVVSGRSKHWHNVKNKHGLLVEIFMDNLQEWYAYELEHELTLKYGIHKEGGKLVNGMHGGWGVSHGSNNPNYDSKKYTFINIYSYEKFVGTKLEFKKEFNFGSEHIFHSCRPHNGWTLETNQTPDEMEQLRKSKAGKNNSRYNSTIYDFTNLRTEENFVGTRYDFENEYFLNISPLFSTTRTRNVVADWCLTSNRDKAVQNSKIDYAQHSLVHKDGEIFIGTRLQFKEKYGIRIDDLFCPSARYKSCKGWSLAPKEIEELSCNLTFSML